MFVKKKRKLFRLLACLFLCSQISLEVCGKTLKVDCDKKDPITDAMLKADPGDVIEVSGTCNETLLIAAEVESITFEG